MSQNSQPNSNTSTPALPLSRSREASFIPASTHLTTMNAVASSSTGGLVSLPIPSIDHHPAQHSTAPIARSAHQSLKREVSRSISVESSLHDQEDELDGDFEIDDTVTQKPTSNKKGKKKAIPAVADAVVASGAVVKGKKAKAKGKEKELNGAAGPAPGPEAGADEVEEWTRTKKDNHKEVERRRRETINDGINALKQIVPGCDKNKGSILQRAAEYIQELKDSESSNIEKWTLEKLLSDQALSESKGEVELYRGCLEGIEEECEDLRKEVERLGALLTVATEGNGGIVNGVADVSSGTVNEFGKRVKL